MTITNLKDETRAPGEVEVAAVIKAALEPVFQRNADKIVAAYLFGSSANGRVGPMSDIDIAVLLTGQTVVAAGDIKIDLYLDCSRALKRNDIDIAVLNTTKNLFLLHDVVSNGVVLFDSDRQLREEFEVKAIHDFIDFKEHRTRVLEG